MNWQDLAEAVQKGDPSAGPNLVSALAPMLDFCALVDAPDLSQRQREDAVQRALQSIVAGIQNYDPNLGSFAAWSRGNLKFKLRDMRRRDPEIAVDPSRLVSFARAERPIDEESSPDALAFAELVARVLTPGEQALLALHIMESMTFAEIADRLGPPANPPALRKRYQRARARVLQAAREDPTLTHLTQENARD